MSEAKNRALTAMALAQRGWSATRGLRWLVRNPWTFEEAERQVADEVRRRDERFCSMLDTLVWPFAVSPLRRLLDHAGLEAGDVRQLVADQGLDRALGTLRDAGVYVAYEEYQGKVEARRGSATFAFTPADFFNPVTRPDYMATTGGSRSTGTPVELSWAWQHRQGMKHVIQRVMADIPGAPSAVWLPVFPSAAGFGAIVKNAAGGLILERWFSQLPSAVDGVAGHKQVANRFLPLLATLTRSGLPSPEHVPTSAPEPVVRWLRDALDRHGKAGLSGYATSVTAVARWAVDHGIDLTGAIAIPSSEPVTASKLAAIRASGMTPRPQYAFVPEGVMAMACGACDDEDYHLWRNEMTVITRRRDRGDGTPVDAFLWTSLDDLSPRVFVNVENDDYGAVVHDVGCDCVLGRLGLTTHVRDIRGMSKVVAAGITLSGDELHHIVEVELPQRLGGGPGDYQFVEEDGPAGTRVSLRVHPRVGSIDHDAAVAAVRAVLARSDNGVLAQRVWMPEGRLHTVREAPAITRGGKTLPYERLGGGPTPAAAPDIS